jgi:flagellar biogenesis protein FliO
MNALNLYLAVGLGVVVLIVVAVIWSLRRMPSEAELDEISRRQEAAARAAGEGD